MGKLQMNAIKYHTSTLNVVKNANNTANKTNEVWQQVSNWLLNNFNSKPKVEELKESEFPKLKEYIKDKYQNNLKPFVKNVILPPLMEINSSENLTAEEKLKELEKQNKSLEASVKMLTMNLEKQKVAKDQKKELEKKIAELHGQTQTNQKETDKIKSENQRLKTTNQILSNKNLDKETLYAKEKFRDIVSRRKYANMYNKLASMKDATDETWFSKWPNNAIVYMMSMTHKANVGQAATMRMLRWDGSRINPAKLPEKMKFFVNKFKPKEWDSVITRKRKEWIMELAKQAYETYRNNLKKKTDINFN